MSALESLLTISGANMSADQLATAIRRIESVGEVVIETNDGTFGAAECCRAVGTGDPAFGRYAKFMSLKDGSVRVQGCDPAIAPGYARHFDTGRRLVTKLKELRRQLRALRR